MKVFLMPIKIELLRKITCVHAHVTWCVFCNEREKNHLNLFRISTALRSFNKQSTTNFQFIAYFQFSPLSREDKK